MSDENKNSQNQNVTDDEAVSRVDIDSLTSDLIDFGKEESPKESEEKDTTGQSGSQDRPAWIDEKFWTGDIESSSQKMAESYRQLQTRHGQMANDLGQNRAMIDKLIGLKREEDLDKGGRKVSNIDAETLLSEPSKVLQEAGQAAVDPVKQEVELLRNELHQTTFLAKHPDAETVANSDEFVAWVTASPSRQRLAQMAQQDWGTAADLLSDFKREVTITQQKTTENSDKAKEEAKRVATEKSTANTGEGRKKYFRRADLARLMLTDRDRYESPEVQAAILKAYKENRVK